MSVGSLLVRSCLLSVPSCPPAGAHGPAVTGATAAPGPGLAGAARPLANNSIWG